MAETKKVRMMVSRGNPAGGIIPAGAVVPLPVFWADRFIADGTAIEVKEDSEKSKKSPKNKK